MLSFFSQKLIPSMFRTSKRKPYRKARITPLCTRSVLQVESLEERLVPATFVEVTNALTLTLGSNESLSSITSSFDNTTGDYTLVLGGSATWAGVDVAGQVVGNGTNTLTVTPKVFTAGINILGASGNSATFNDSTRNFEYADPISIDFTNAASTAVTFNGTSYLVYGINVTVDGAINVSGGAFIDGGTGAIYSLSGEASSGAGITIAGEISAVNSNMISLSTTTSGDIALDSIIGSGSSEIKITSAGAITESGSCLLVTAGTLTTSSANGTTLTDGINEIGTFNATDNSTTGIAFNNYQTNLIISGISESSTGAVDVQTIGIGGSITTTGAIAAQSSAVTLTANGGALSIGAGIDASTAGSVTLSNTGSGNTLTINGVINSNNAVSATSAGNIQLNQNVTGSSATFQADSGGAGNETLSFGTGVIIDADTQSYRSGNGSSTTSNVDLITNSPLFNGSAGNDAPTSFTYEQDAAIQGTNLPTTAPTNQFPIGNPTSYAIISDQGGVSINAADNVNSLANTNLTLQASSGSVVIGESPTLTSINVSAQQISLDDDVTTTAVSGTTQTYTGSVLLGVSATLTGAAITFNSTVDDSAVGADTLSIDGNVVFDGAVGGAVALASLSVSGSASTGSLIGSINTTDGQTYSGPVVLGGKTTMTSTGSGNITFGGTVQSDGNNESLTVNTAGITIFSGAVGGAGNTLGALTTDANGSTQINGGSIDTAGYAQTYNDNVTLGQPSTLLTGTVDFNAGLTLGATATTATSMLQITGNLNLASTSKLTQTIAGSASSQYGNITVTGSVSLGNAALSVNVNGFTPAVGEAFETIDNQGMVSVSGTFAGLAEGTEFTSDSVPFRISYVGGTGGDNVVLAAFPASVTANPTNQAIYAGNTATFTAAGTSATVIWQGSADGGATFVDLADGGNYSGVNTTTLTIVSVSLSFNNFQYRAVFGVGAGQAPTAAATLTVVSQYSSAAYQAAYGAYAYAYGAYVAGEGANAYLTMNNAYSSYYYAYYSYYYNSIGNYSASQSAAYYAYYYGYLAAYYASVDYSATGNSDILAIYDYAYVAYYESYQTALGY